jgi:hypothetical protein
LAIEHGVFTRNECDHLNYSQIEAQSMGNHT